MKKDNKLNNMKHVDYKDVELLKKFLTPHARMMSGRATGVGARQQRKLAMAIKQARYMALIPYITR